MSPERAALAERQAALMAALCAGAPVPAGFDVARVEAVARGLCHKRRRSAAHAWAGLAEELGPRFDALFERYAARHAAPLAGGPLADAWAFVDWLARSERLAPRLALEHLQMGLRFRRTREGVRARRGPALGVRWLGWRGGLLAGVRLGARGEYCWCWMYRGRKYVSI